MRKDTVETNCDKTWIAAFAILLLTIPGLPEEILRTVDVSADIQAQISQKQSKSLDDYTRVFISFQMCIGRLYIEETGLFIFCKNFNRFEWQAYKRVDVYKTKFFYKSIKLDSLYCEATF
jgi:hypothetical protein